ncbi:ABC transporter ATP-binding protein [Listeria monocytogenes]|jgi:ABC-type cobalamin/Fe3+-siderophores transport systems, ATPase components|uniref:Lmo2182 protein n=3 Tax=Listeria monocytogenes TaxID=1639 RepID=Q8Y587_LISMO|nr:ABC transporter ATP-binding protein [Listeria monocytogenes]NP_465706.1 ferrichrome ABC transporter ATP-binding protein [Listeria monocytogenes EGD-e]EAA0166391.1 ABC transporter ATP-binding protein [Listeria monocytogenes serotype 1/2a]EAE3701960.1 ABC transporter ATP-binding protein [Listeria monocytogenes serotype 1/2c]EAE6022378.1 ABC transporter ATP-binding protein [Listeria monocytogenes serotype 3a]EAF4505134.1 ABC transporter ATP-binding protein [Listeria monocytogenes serotype 4b]
MEVRDVNFSYNGTDAILKNVSFTIQKNKINTIVGPNGSGKSTLLEILARLLSPNSGDVLLEGKSIFEWKAKEFAQNVAIVHQSNVLPNELMVKELLYFGRLPYKNWRMTRTKEDDLAVERALMQTELTEKAEKFVDSLSGGERQRVFIATALVQDTPILLLDEPTTFLDMYFQLEILELVKRLNQEENLTIVMILHDLNQALMYSDHLIVMKNGEVVAKGEPEELLTTDLIAETYGVVADVLNDANNGKYIVPQRRKEF